MEENTVTSMEEDSGKRKKNQRVQVTYINGEGEHKVPPADCAGFRTVVKDDKGEVIVDEVNKFGDMPKEINVRALAFGYNVLARNSVNTALSIEEGAEAFIDRFSGFRNGVWRTAGEGGGSSMTDVIQAMVNAVTAAGWEAEKIEAKTAEWIEHYASLTKENKKKQNAAWLSKAPVKAAYDELLTKKAQERLAKLKAAAKDSKKGAGNAEDLTDL